MSLAAGCLGLELLIPTMMLSDCGGFFLRLVLSSMPPPEASSRKADGPQPVVFSGT